MVTTTAIYFLMVYAQPQAQLTGPNAGNALAEYAVWAALMAAAGLFGLVVRRVLAIDTTLVELRVTLTGIDGQNGIRGDVRLIREDFREHRSASHDRNERLSAAITTTGARVEELARRLERQEEGR